MAYLGTPPQSGFITTAKQRVTSSTNNYVDLDHAISSIADVIVFVNFVKQDTTNLSLTTSTRITLGGTLVSSDIVEIHYLGKAVNTQTPATGTVTNDMLAGSIANDKLAGSIANDKLANSSITLNGSAVSLGGSATVGGNNTPAFAIGMNADQGPNNNTFTLMEFNNEEVDTDNAYTNTAGNYKFTVPSGKAGKYFIYAFTLCNAINADDFISGAIALYKNGSNTVESTLNVRNDRIRYNTSYIGHVFDLSEGDYIQAYAFVDSDDGSVKFNSGANSRFGGFKLI